MGKRLVISAVAVLGLATIIISWISWPSRVPDPVYNGQQLSQLLKSTTAIFLSSPSGLPAISEPLVLVISNNPRTGINMNQFQTVGMPPLDSNALPMLLQILKRGASPFWRTYAAGFQRSPQWLRSRLPVPEYSIEETGTVAVLLARFGTGARPAVPTLIRMSKDSRLSLYAVWALGEIGDRSQPVLDAINQNTAGTNAVEKEAAKAALRKLGVNLPGDGPDLRF